ncbi:hypothetical protein H1C71_008042 [Ictidomys tridecemlineatus]|nr:hypothetical protein H1C71_008042 [Ictidomys tridecemlineatus]
MWQRKADRGLEGLPEPGVVADHRPLMYDWVLDHADLSPSFRQAVLQELLLHREKCPEWAGGPGSPAHTWSCPTGQSGLQLSGSPPPAPPGWACPTQEGRSEDTAHALPSAGCRAPWYWAWGSEVTQSCSLSVSFPSARASFQPQGSRAGASEPSSLGRASSHHPVSMGGLLSLPLPLWAIFKALEPSDFTA